MIGLLFNTAGFLAPILPFPTDRIGLACGFVCLACLAFDSATLEGGSFASAGLRTIDFCFPVFAADFITRFRFEADGFGADVIGAVDFVLTVFVDPDFNPLSFEDDF